MQQPQEKQPSQAPPEPPFPILLALCFGTSYRFPALSTFFSQPFQYSVSRKLTKQSKSKQLSHSIL